MLSFKQHTFVEVCRRLQVLDGTRAKSQKTSSLAPPTDTAARCHVRRSSTVCKKNPTSSGTHETDKSANAPQFVICTFFIRAVHFRLRGLTAHLCSRSVWHLESSGLKPVPGGVCHPLTPTSTLAFKGVATRAL